MDSKLQQEREVNGGTPFAEARGSTARLKVRIVQISDWSTHRLVRAEKPIGKDIKRSIYPERLAEWARQNGMEVVP